MAIQPTTRNQPPIRAVRMSLFPSMDTLDSAVKYCKAQLPSEHSNTVMAILMVYHNTLLDQIPQQS